MGDKKKRKVSLKKRQKAEAAYNSDSDVEEFTKQDLIDNDILQDDGLDNDFSEDNISLSDDDDFKERKEKVPQKDKAEIEEGKTTKLSSVISKILETGAKTNRPVLSLKRKIEKDIDEEKLEERAKKLLTTDKKKEKDVGRIIPDNSDLDYEKSLRKMATKGVVQLFNALRAAQKSVNEVENDGVLKNVDVVPSVSKETFIKALKQEKEITNAEAVPFLQDDYGMKAPKHWDEEEDEMEDEMQYCFWINMHTAVLHEQLFVVGFMSSGFAGPLVGNMSDRLGRKTGCISFCFLYGLSCATKLSSNFQVLLLGRVTGGVSTSLLMTVFESWVIEQHKALGLEERSLSAIFSKSTLINSLVAILSGLIANAVVSVFGLVSPFLVSGGLLLLAALLIHNLWPEHYKTSQESSSGIRDACKVMINSIYH
ncbi:Molybdate-anion transporter [Terramyces sp. JEL0728]|nr:Molybdate-anion transporter [Terramyces sp. JEL0728]